MECGNVKSLWNWRNDSVRSAFHRSVWTQVQIPGALIKAGTNYICNPRLENGGWVETGRADWPTSLDESLSVRFTE